MDIRKWFAGWEVYKTGGKLCPMGALILITYSRSEEFSPHRKENSTIYHYKHQPVNVV
jgi:hypothetical protein